MSEYKSTITPYKKVVVIEAGTIERMYWEHPSGNQTFDHVEVMDRWKELYGVDQDFTDQQFLVDHGFFSSNIIRDGQRPTS